MSKLYISEKTLNKLSESKEYQNYVKLFNRFNIEPSNQKSTQTSKQKPTHIKINNPINTNNKPNPETNIAEALRKMKETLAATKHSYVSPPQKAKTLSQMLKEKKRKHPIAKSIKKPKLLRPKVIKLKTNHKTLKKKSKTNSVYLKEHHLLAGEYATSKSTNLKRRYAEIKTKNNVTLGNCRRSKESELKRDWTDRFALK